MARSVESGPAAGPLANPWPRLYAGAFRGGVRGQGRGRRGFEPIGLNLAPRAPPRSRFPWLRRRRSAAQFGDAVADTLGHIALACAKGDGNRTDLRSGALHVPHLDALGLGLATEASTGVLPPGLTHPQPPRRALGFWGRARAWQGYAVRPLGNRRGALPGALGYFTKTEPCFPPELTKALIAKGGLSGILGNCHASGTEIIARLGAEHIRAEAPICYTSADRVLQIAAHETIFGLDRLYELCRIARRLCDPLNIGRVIARPSKGPKPRLHAHATPQGFRAAPAARQSSRTARGRVAENRVDRQNGRYFRDLFTGEEIKRENNMAHFAATLEALPGLPDGGLIFTNFLDFDTDLRHRRDVPGYAHCLQAFDARLPELFALMGRAMSPSSPPTTAMIRHRRHRPHPRACAHSRLWPRHRNPPHRPARNAR